MIALPMALMGGGGGGVSGGGGKLELIDRQALTVAGSAVTFSGLTGDADKAYLLVVNVVGNGGSGLTDFALRFNNDTGGNYPYAQLTVDGTVPSSAAAGAGGATEARCGRINGAGVVLVWIFASREGANRGRHVVAQSWHAGGRSVDVFGSGWTNTADELTEIDTYTGGVNLDIGTEFTLYRVSP